VEGPPPVGETSGWQGIAAPRDTPNVEKLNAEINAALANEKMRPRISDLGASVFSLSAADFKGVRTFLHRLRN
jgi:tripartite-type tricarboxylate transporter receptor subunit TctC